MNAPVTNRRDVLNVAAAAGTLSVLLPKTASSSIEQNVVPPPIIDTNISLFQWPFRRLPLDRTDVLMSKLKSLGVVQAWASSFEGLLHRDIAGVNRRLAAECRGYAELVPIGCVNPRSPNWQDDFRRCIEDHHMPGIRIYPNYHGYTLNAPRFRQLLQQASDSGTLIQLAATMEDTRTQHALVRVPEVDLKPLESLLQNIGGVQLQILNLRQRAAAVEQLASVPGVFFDTARVDGTDGLPNLVRSVPAGRVLFGSHAPFLIPEAALIRVHESGQLPSEALQAVLSKNAEQILGA